MGWFNKKNNENADVEKSVNNTIENADDTDATPVDQEQKEIEEWVWVDGYKGLDENMQGYENFQYELNKEYCIEGDVKECSNGFHFCLNMAHVLKYYPFEAHETNRYFKVRGLVRKKDLDEYGTYYRNSYHWFDNMHDKLVAKKIVVVEEITYDELVIDAINKKHNIEINNVDEYNEIRKTGWNTWIKNKCTSMIDGKYSQAFIQIFTDKVYTSYGSDWRIVQKYFEEAAAYVEEGVSKDVAVYLLMKDL